MHITDQTSQPAAFYRFTLGELELTVVSDGHILFDPPQPVLAPGIPHAQFVSVLESYFLPTSYVDIAMNILVIKKGRKLILVDAGAGTTMGTRSGWLLPNLEIAGIRPDDVTDVLLSHAHSDHVGGVLREDGSLAFPNASVHMTRAEHDFWLSAKVELTNSKLADKKGFLDFSVPIVQAAKAALGTRLHLLEPGVELFDSINLVPAPGHTPGHTAFLIRSQNEELFHMGDAAHTHVILFEHPEWGFEADADFDQGVATRLAIMNQLADNRKRAFSFHLPWPGLGHVRRKNQAFEWVAEQFTSFAAGKLKL